MSIRKLIKKRMIDSLNNIECKRTEFNDKHAKISEEICKGKEYMEKISQNRRLIQNK